MPKINCVFSSFHVSTLPKCVTEILESFAPRDTFIITMVHQHVKAYNAPIYFVNKYSFIFLLKSLEHTFEPFTLCIHHTSATVISAKVVY